MILCYFVQTLCRKLRPPASRVSDSATRLVAPRSTITARLVAPRFFTTARPSGVRARSRCQPKKTIREQNFFEIFLGSSTDAARATTATAKQNVSDLE
jgi:hypothetical protein